LGAGRRSRSDADPDTFKDAGKAKELQEEYDQFKHRLAQLEEEYFSREE
jgi:hypothetical protein